MYNHQIVSRLQTVELTALSYVQDNAL